MKDFLYDIKLFLEKIDGARDKILFIFIKPYWPRRILPNHLTVVRIIIGLSLFIFLFYFKNTSELFIISLFCVGALTDMLDGSVARGLHEETKLGAILDSVADRILIIPIAVYSLFTLHRWLFLLLILLEVINALLSVYAQGKNIFIKSNIFGKIKMVLQSVVFGAILIFWPRPPNMFFIDLLWISMYFIIISIFFKILELQTAQEYERN